MGYYSGMEVTQPRKCLATLKQGCALFRYDALARHSLRTLTVFYRHFLYIGMQKGSGKPTVFPNPFPFCTKQRNIPKGK